MLIIEAVAGLEFEGVGLVELVDIDGLEVFATALEADENTPLHSGYSVDFDEFFAVDVHFELRGVLLAVFFGPVIGLGNKIGIHDHLLDGFVVPGESHDSLKDVVFVGDDDLGRVGDPDDIDDTVGEVLRLVEVDVFF